MCFLATISCFSREFLPIFHVLILNFLRLIEAGGASEEPEQFCILWGTSISETATSVVGRYLAPNLLIFCGTFQNFELVPLLRGNHFL